MMAAIQQLGFMTLTLSIAGEKYCKQCNQCNLIDIPNA